ncbi:response regulator transcription factor [Rhizobium sp. G187]|uniref:response regulator transcription factor n=1 Tax=Rhizobium sp. G187 TaxID=3451352 RepID=UPI003EE58267
MRILLIEDDARIARDVTTQLERAGYTVLRESDGEAGLFAGMEEDFTTVILDLGLPGLDGLSILRRWRSEGRTMPVLILTARGTWQEKVEGIDAGADDYLPKPFQIPELLARLRAIIRRSAGHASPILSFGDITLDIRTKAVTQSGLSIDLTPMEYRFISHLALNADRHVSQAELTEQLYAQDFERDSNSIEVLVGRIRRKLGRDAVMTKRGYGYRIGGAD